MSQAAVQSVSAVMAGTPGESSPYKVLRRDGTVTDFDPSRINVAISKAFIAVEGEPGATSSKMRDLAQKLTLQVVETLKRRVPDGGV
ncbi:MAG: ATP cone domain-containing protein, partial [Terriglobales bacterium]